MLKKIGLSFLTLVLIMSMSVTGLAMAEEAVPANTQEAATTAATENPEESNAENTSEEATAEESAETEATKGEPTANEPESTESEAAQDTEADEETTEQATAAEAGITPDSIFYRFDRLIEQLQLMLTAGEAAKAELLAKLADERLAEAEAMATLDKVALAEQAIKDFTTTLKAVTENIEAAALDTGSLSDDAKLEAAVASLQALREGFAQRIEELMATIDPELEEDPADAVEEAGDTADNLDAMEDEDGEDGDGPVHLKQAIVTVYQLPENTFDVLMNERGLNWGQAKMVAILMGKLQARNAEAADEATATTDETAATAEGTTEDISEEQAQVDALNSLIDEVLGMRAKGWGQVKKDLALQSGEIGQAVGKVLKQAGVAVEADDDDSDETDAEAPVRSNIRTNNRKSDNGNTKVEKGKQEKSAKGRNK